MKVYVTVAIDIDADSEGEMFDVISECDYGFTFEGDELQTEIVEVETADKQLF